MGYEVKAIIERGVVAVMLIFGWAQPAIAQSLIDLVPSAEFRDERGVDLAGLIYRHHEALLSIGAGPHPLSLNLSIVSPGPVPHASCIGYGDIGNAIYLGLSSHAYHGNTVPGTGDLTVVLPHQSAKFFVTGPAYNRTAALTDDHYATLAYNPGYTQLDYIGVDGTEATFPVPGHAASTGSQDAMVWGGVGQIRFADGETWTYRYNDASYNASGCGGGQTSRVRSIVSSRGYAIQFNYASEATGTLSSASVVRDWVSPIRATAYNKAVVFCDETALASCASVAALNSAVTFAYNRTTNKVTITKPNGEQVELTFDLVDTLNLTSVTRPGSVTRTMTYTVWSEQEGPTYRFLTSLTEGGGTWGYGFSPNSSHDSSMSISDPGGAATFHQFTNGQPYITYDPLMRQTQFSYTGHARFLSRLSPEGIRVTAGYDARGNLNLVTLIPKAGTPSLPSLQASAVFPSACTTTNRRTCNQPTSATDRNGNTTDFAYDAAHGGMLTETGPAVGGIRPQTRHEYAQRTAWISNGSGGYAAAAPIWVRTASSICRTSAATGNPASPCATAGDEVRTAYDYGPDTGPNLLLMRGQTVAADGVTLRTCYGYDVNGNRISEHQPNANLASCP